MEQETDLRKPQRRSTIQTTAPKSPITSMRPLATDLEPTVNHTVVANGRQNAKAARSFPPNREDYTAIQKHVLFWDRDADGVISPYDTYVGFRDLSFNNLFSIIAALVFHATFSFPTRMRHSWLPDPLFRIYINSVYTSKGSDSVAFERDSGFDSQLFNAFFSESDITKAGSLSLKELIHMMLAHPIITSTMSWTTTSFISTVTWFFTQRAGRVYMDDLREVYDGTYFWKMRDRAIKQDGWMPNFVGFILFVCVVISLLMCMYAFFGIPSILSRRPVGNAILESAWIPRTCPPHGGVILQPNSTKQVSTIVKESLNRCVLRTADTTERLNVRVSRQLYHSGVDFPCVNAAAGRCAVQLDMSRMCKVVSLDPSNLRITVQPAMQIDDLMDVLHEYDMAVPVEYIPLYTGLTVGGMLLSGAHGSSVEIPSAFGHLVDRVTYVDGKGEIHEEQNPKNFIGSMGMLGVVTEMTIRAVEPYKINTTVFKESDIRLSERVGALVKDPAFSRVMWYPNAHTALLRWHTRVHPDTPGDAYHSFFENRPWAAIGGQLSLAVDQINYTPLPTDWGICLFARHPPPFWWKEGRYGRWLEFNQSVIGWSHRLGGSSCKGSQWGCYWRNQVQLLVEMDMDVSVLGDWIREIRALVDTIEAKGCLPSLLGFAIRFGKASDAYMDMAYGRDTAYIDMLIARGIVDLPAHHQGVLDEVEQISFCKYGARPHWGKNTKRIFLNTKCPVRDKYPGLERFLGLAEAHDPHGIFRPASFQKIVDRESFPLYPGCVAGGDCYCEEDRHCGPTWLYKCVNGRHDKAANVCRQKIGRE